MLTAVVLEIGRSSYFFLILYILQFLISLPVVSVTIETILHYLPDGNQMKSLWESRRVPISRIF